MHWSGFHDKKTTNLGYGKIFRNTFLKGMIRRFLT
jgi:hypothetical protein